MIWKDQDGFLEKIKNEQQFGIFLDMGVGKTALLLGLADHKFFNGVKKILIITPKKVSLSTWQNEIAKWENFSYMSSVVSLIEGTENERNELLKKKGEFCIHIISSSLTEWLYGRKVRKGTYSIFAPNPFTPSYDLVIVDECSQFKSTKSLRYKALKKLTENKSLFLLSGTPFSNIKKEKYYYTNADELYYLTYLLGIYKKSLTQFRADFCFTQPWNKFKYLIHEDMYKSLIEEINKKSIRKRLEIDIKVNQTIVYSKLDKARFNLLKNEFYLETNGYEKITASTQAIMLNKSLQLSNGFVYDSQSQVVRINDYKLEKLKDIISVSVGNIIIFYNFKEDKEYILKNISNSKVLKTKEDIESWNRGEIKILILSPFSEKYGLNLQQGGNTIIWFGLVWSAESYAQANARLVRRGQEKDVEIYYLLAENSFDDYVYKTLILKTETISNFINYV
jgi:SNF2 family DNA or RNA helicase